MYDKHNKLDFVQPFDGTQHEIDASEKSIVAAKFSSFVDDVLLNYIDDVRHFDLFDEDSVSLRLPEGNNFYAISIRSISRHENDEVFQQSEQTQKSINIQHIVDKLGRDSLSYRLAADGIVRRWDGGDVWAQNQKQRELGVDPHEGMADNDMSLEELRDLAAKNLAKLMTDVVPNGRLERDMGYNEQPVSLEETNALVDMLSSSELVVNQI